MTDVEIQLLSDYARGRNRGLIARDLGVSIPTMVKRVDALMSRVDRIPDYNRQREFGSAVLAAYWQLKHQRLAFQHAKLRRSIGGRG